MSKLGATGLEVEMMMAVIGISAVVIVFYLNVKNLINKANNTKMITDASAISQAISLYTVEKGHLPPEINTNEMEVSNINGQCSHLCRKVSGCVNLLTSILPYLEVKKMSYLEGYSVQLGKNGMVTVKACLSEMSETMEVTR